MHNCSKEFILKHSNPKMSSTPTNNLTSSRYPMERFVCDTTKLKMMPYRALASASRLSEACRTFTGLRIFSVRVTRVVLQSAPSKSFRVTPRSFATRSMDEAHSCITIEPSLLFGGASNFEFPRLSTAAATLRMLPMSSLAMPMVCMAMMRRSKNSTSFTSFKVLQLERVV